MKEWITFIAQCVLIAFVGGFFIAMFKDLYKWIKERTNANRY